MKTTEAPMVIGSIMGVILILEYFLDIPLLATVGSNLRQWGIIVAGFALMLAALNLVRIHLVRLSESKDAEEKIFSIILLAGLFSIAITGIGLGQENPIFRFLFDDMVVPLGATIFSSLIFFIVSASFRAFRARNLDATLLLIAGILIMLGKAPVGEVIWAQFPALAEWIQDYPNLAGNRGILIGTGVGTVALGLRILTGLDRSHLGGQI